MISRKAPEQEPGEPRILRKRGGRRNKGPARFGDGTLPPRQDTPQKPGLFAFTLNLIYKNLYLLGMTLLRRRLKLRRGLRMAGLRVKQQALLSTAGTAAVLRRWGERFKAQVKAPFLRIQRTYREVLPDINSKRARGKFPFAAYMAVLESIWQLIFKILATIFNYTAPVLAVIFLVVTINQRLREPMVYVLTYNGEIMGYINNQAEFNEAAQEVRSRVTINGESAFAVSNPHFELMRKSEFEERRADPNGGIPVAAGKIEPDKLPDMLILASDTEVEEAYGFYIDNRFLGAIVEKDPVLDKLNEIKYANMTGKPDETLAFTKSVRMTRLGLYPKSSVTTDDAVIEILTSNESASEIYVVKDGDSPSLIADKTGVPYEVLKELNPDIETNLKAGMEVYTQVARPYMSVESTYTDVTEEEIPFETIKVENATYAKGYSNVFQTGENGLRKATYRVSTVDGLERRRVEIGEEIVKHPVPERVTVGINNPVYVAPKPTAPAQSSSGSGQQQQPTAPAKPQQPVAAAPSRTGFIRPVPAGVGYVSCYLGGYPGHTGIDIAVVGGTGTPILASASGVVVKAVNSNMGYGRHIMIDHGNGYQTLYAHNSALYVSVGDYVTQGQVIAAMGRTGNATGVHVHFEVKYNGRIMNPVDYIGRY